VPDLSAGATAPGRLGIAGEQPEALLALVDAGLERGDAALQFGEVALEDLAAARLVSESCSGRTPPSARRRVWPERAVWVCSPQSAPVLESHGGPIGAGS
jgi:hypothetical protein